MTVPPNPSPSPSAGESATFAMLCCAHGAEAVVKREIAAAGWRLAFSRPGFVTAKHDVAADLPGGVFVRTAARSIGQARNSASAELIDGLRRAIDGMTSAQPFDQVHVWPKDRLPIGKFGFEPGPDEVTRAVSAAVIEALRGDASPQSPIRCDVANQIAQPGERILDVVLVEPSHWFFGVHTATTWSTRWPGGVQPVDPAETPVSRAYFKAAEAITWSGFDVQPGDRAVEIGSAPGGACARLLEMGMEVIGIDPAEMDPRITAHRKFRHIRARAGDLPRRDFKSARWMLVDSNVKPDQTLTTVENIVNHRHSEFEGLLLTMKIGDYKHADRIEGWRERVGRWNPAEVRVRQLARNRCEVCFAIRMR